MMSNRRTPPSTETEPAAWSMTSATPGGEVIEPELLQDPYHYQREQHARYEQIRYLFSLPTPITYLLIGVIVAVYIWCLSIDHSLLGKWDSAPRDSIYMGANWPPPIHAEGQWWRTLSSVFLHGGLLHIGFNAYALYVLGPMVERLSGGARYFILIVAAGLGGAVASLVWSDAPSVGISGSIFGLVGALLGIIRKFRDELPDQMAISIRRGMIQIALINLGIGLVHPMIDNAAHIGGFVTGFVVASLMQSRLRAPDHNAQRAAIAALLLAGLSAYAMLQMHEQNKTCGRSEQAFMACYADYMPQLQQQETQREAVEELIP